MTKDEERKALLARGLALADGTRSILEIATELGVCVAQASSFMEALRVLGKNPKGKCEPRNSFEHSDLQTVLRRRNEVFDGTRTRQQVADYFCVSKPTVSAAIQILHLAGIETKLRSHMNRRKMAEDCLLGGGSFRDAMASSGLSEFVVKRERAKLRKEGKLKVVTGTSVLDEMYQSGASHKAIAEATGLAMSSVASMISRRIKKGLLTMRKQGGYARVKGRKRTNVVIADQVNEAARLAMLGLTNFEIMTKMGLTMLQVQLRMAAARKLGLVTKDRRTVCMKCHQPGHNRRTCSNISP